MGLPETDIVTSRSASRAYRDSGRSLREDVTGYGLAAGVSVAAGAALASNAFAVAVVIALAALILAPRWLLLAAGVTTAAVLPGRALAGGLEASDVLLGVFALRAAVSWLLQRRRSGAALLTLGSPALWFALFVVWAWISLVAAGAGSTTLALGRISLYVAVMLIAATDRQLARPMMLYLIALGCFEVVYGVVTLDVGTRPRLVGTRDDPHELGIMALAAVAAVPLLPSRLRPIAAALLATGL